jgi:hypothetical protein
LQFLDWCAPALINFILQRLPFSLEANGNKKTLLSYSPTSQAVE